VLESLMRAQKVLAAALDVGTAMGRSREGSSRAAAWE